MRRKAIPSKILEEGNLDLFDLKILQGMVEGKTQKEIAMETDSVERTVRSRIDALESKGIIIKGKRQIPLVDIFKLWNHVFITHIKLHLPSAVPMTARHELARVIPTPPPPAWFDALEEMKRDNPLFDKIVRYAFAMMGTEYDMLLIITTQSIDEYAEFFDNLQRKTGIIEKVWGTRVVERAGYHYDPIAVPNPDDAEESLISIKDSFDQALRRIKKREK